MKADRHDHARSPTALTERLRHRCKITPPRRAILEVLGNHPHPVSIKEIIRELPKADCDPATVYRSIHLFEELGLIKRFDLADGVARFELVHEGDDGHHHHLVCTRCSGVVEVDECFVSELESRIAADHGFKAVTHRLEFFGICPACQ
jgi:Fur family transcriptional regulator, ferric uptake regulator